MTAPLLALSLSNTVLKVGALAAFAALVGIAVLSLLVFSQARELKRLREWAGRAPERAAELEQRVSTEAAARLQRVGEPRVGGVAPVPRTTPVVTRAAAAAGPATRVVAGQPAGGVVTGAAPVPSTAAASAAHATSAPPQPGVLPSVQVAPGQPTGTPPGQPPAEPVPGQPAFVPTPQPGAPQEPAQADSGKEVENVEDAAKAAPVGAENGSPVAEKSSTPKQDGAAQSGVAGQTQISPGAPAQEGGAPSVVGGVPTPATAAARAAVPAGRAPTPPAPTPATTAAPRPARPVPPMPSRPGGAPPAARRVPGETSGAAGAAGLVGGRAGRAQGPPFLQEERSPGRTTALIVGGVVFGVAVLVGILLSVGGGSGKGHTTSTGASRSASVKRSRTPHTHAAVASPAETQVVVLNGTETNGLAHRLSANLQQSGYAQSAALDAHPTGRSTSVVEYAGGHHTEALHVAQTLGIAQVQPLEGAVQPLVGSAMVVVIAGADQAALGGEQ